MEFYLTVFSPRNISANSPTPYEPARGSARDDFLMAAALASPGERHTCCSPFPLRLRASSPPAPASRRHGWIITFINPGSFPYSRSNQFAPSDSGALTEMIGSTLISPLAIRSMHSGYSPFEAHEP